MHENFLKYVFLITEKLNKFFEEQKEFIFCKRGCAKCCKNAQFPFTEIEFDFINDGMLRLDKEIQMQIMDKVEKILEAKKQSKEEIFRYDCPFLIDDVCSVYNYRGLICRSFGLASFKKGKETKFLVPFCAYEGLNYSNFLNSENKKDKSETSDTSTEPIAYNTSYPSLIDEEMANQLGFSFGEAKPLIEWFENL